MRLADMKIRLDETLKNDFRSICDAMDITASQRIRQMMKSWVDECRQNGITEKPEKQKKWSSKFYDRLVL